MLANNETVVHIRRNPGSDSCVNLKLCQWLHVGLCKLPISNSSFPLHLSASGLNSTNIFMQKVISPLN